MGAKTVEGILALGLGIVIALYWLFKTVQASRDERPVFFFLFLATLGWIVVALLLNRDISPDAFWFIRALNLIVLLFMAYGLFRVQRFEEWWHSK